MASKCISQHAQSWLPSPSLSSLELSLQLHLKTRSITASKCIPKLSQLQPPSASLSSLHLSVSKCISKLAQSWPPSTSLSSLDLSLLVHLQTRAIMAYKYIFKKQSWLYGDTGVTEVDTVEGSIYSADPGVDRHHLNSITSYHSMEIHTVSFPTFGLTHSVRDLSKISWIHAIFWMLNAG